MNYRPIPNADLNLVKAVVNVQALLESYNSQDSKFMQFPCGTNHSKVSGTYESDGEALNCILLWYQELSSTKLFIKTFFSQQQLAHNGRSAK